MKRRLVIGLVGLCWGLLLTEAIPASAMSIELEPVPEKPGICNGVYKDTQVAPDELASVLEKHKMWLGQKPNGQQANLCGARLAEPNLQKANLQKANLQEALLERANLQEAVLIEANLQKALLVGANLQKANLGWANLQEAVLERANLQEANLIEANLQKARLVGANLQKTCLPLAKLQEADLKQATLDASYFEPVSLPDIRSIASAYALSTLQFVRSPQALQELRDAFKKAGYRRQEREITYALWHTQRVQDMDFPRTREPVPKCRTDQPTGQEHGEGLPPGEAGGLLQHGEGLFKLVLFEWPCAYGMQPGRPLLLLVLLLPLFAIVYLVALRTRGAAGIWAVWPTDRVHKHADEETPRRLTHEAPFPKPPAPEGTQTVPPDASRCTDLCTTATPGQCALCDALAERDRFLQWFPAARLALYFSLLSAFHLGWRELNVGTWITRLQPREYTLRATGWVRTVAGVQSLLSVYLLALWALTYFGRPFE